MFAATQQVIMMVGSKDSLEGQGPWPGDGCMSTFLLPSWLIKLSFLNLNGEAFIQSKDKFWVVYTSWEGSGQFYLSSQMTVPS